MTNVGRDLGTFHVKVVLKNGTGWIEARRTGRRYTHGRGDVHPLSASSIAPIWDSEDDLRSGILYWFLHGSGSCDCNKRLALAKAAQAPEPETPFCGDTLEIATIELIRPDGTEVVIYNQPKASR